jgi:muramidase (phage lysozyme)
VATIIDALVVTLGLDSSKFTAQQKLAVSQLARMEQQAQKTATTLERSGSQGAAFFDVMKSAALGLSGVLAGLGLKNIAMSALNTGAATSRLASNLAMSTEDLTKWQLAAEHIAGGSAEGVSSVVQNLATQFEGLANGIESGTLPFFRRLGVTLTDNQNKLKTTTQIMLELNRAVQGMDPRKANFLLSGAGITDQGTRNLLMKPPATLRAELAEQQKRNAVNQLDADKLREANDAIIGVTQDLTSLGRELTVEAIPQIRTLASVIRDVSDWVRGRIRFTDIGKTQEERDADKTEPSWMTDPILMARRAAEKLNGVNEAVQDPGTRIVPRVGNWLRSWLPERMQQPASPVPGGPGSEPGGAGAGAVGTNSAEVPPEGRALLQTITKDEAGGSYNTSFGGQRVADLSHHPDLHTPIPGREGMYSSAFGAYQMIKPTWDKLQKDLNLPDMSPASQDRAAWELAKRSYKGDLLADLKSGDPKKLGAIADALKSQWTSLPGGAEQGSHAGSFVMRLGALLKQSVGSTANAATPTQPAAGGATPLDTTGGAGHSDGLRSVLDGLRGAAPTPDAQAAPAPAQTSSNADVRIGSMTIHTAAKDAKEVASAIGGELRSAMLVPQANRGLS